MVLHTISCLWLCYTLCVLSPTQDQNLVGVSRPVGPIQPPVPVPVPGPGTAGPGSMAGNPGGSGYLGNQQQAAMMKQLLMEQERQRMHQIHLMEQQKQQLFREQRQQQQFLAEQVNLHYRYEGLEPKTPLMPHSPKGVLPSGVPPLNPQLV